MSKSSIKVEVSQNVSFWDDRYVQEKGDNFPSPFAEFCVNNYIKKNAKILELGCGNGRDAFYFSKNEIFVHGLDLSKAAVASCNKRVVETKLEKLLQFSEADIDDFESYFRHGTNIIYSRFSIHSVSEDVENNVLIKAYNLLPQDGFFLIEVRTIFDELFGKGEKISETEYIDDHYRRFIDSAGFINRCLRIGWRLKYFIEDRGLAPYQNEDPIIARFVLQKD